MSKTVTFGAKPKTTPAQTAAEDWVKSRHAEPETMKRLTIDIPGELHARMKSQCALNGVKMADEVRLLLLRHFGPETSE